MVNLCNNKNHLSFNKDMNNCNSSSTNCSNIMNLSSTRTYSLICAKSNITATALPQSLKAPILANVLCIKFLKIHFR